MKKLLPILLLLLTAGTYAQTRQFDIGKIKVNGIGLRAEHAAVTEKFGTPKLDYGSQDVPYRRTRVLEYTGVDFLFWVYEDGEHLLSKVTLDSPRQGLSGIRVGSTLAAVKRKFGRNPTVPGYYGGERDLIYQDGEKGELNLVSAKGEWSEYNLNCTKTKGRSERVKF